MPPPFATPTFPVPPGACDCHVHIVLDQAAYPMDPARVYTPPAATPAHLMDVQRRLHLDHAVVVQPSFYGTDNAATLDGMRSLGARRARGVAVIGPSTSAAEMDLMARHGIAGVRINLETAGIADPAAASRLLDDTVRQIAGLPWHIQVYANPSVVAALHDQFAALPVPVVFDHFGGAEAARGADQPGFTALLDLVRSGRAWAKLSGSYRASKAAPDYPDVTPLARALIAANPARLVWGSDWPHTGSTPVPGRKPTDISPPQDIDPGALLNLLGAWAPDAAVRRQILVDNPRRLYGFA